MKTPDRRIVFTFYSHPVREVKRRWKAHLTFEPSSVDDSFAELVINDGEGRPIEGGLFEFAGSAICVRNGFGRLRCRDFVLGKHEGSIWLHRKGSEPVPGALTFE